MSSGSSYFHVYNHRKGRQFCNVGPNIKQEQLFFLFPLFFWYLNRRRRRGRRDSSGIVALILIIVVGTRDDNCYFHLWLDVGVLLDERGHSQPKGRQYQFVDLILCYQLLSSIVIIIAVCCNTLGSIWIGSILLLIIWAGQKHLSEGIYCWNRKESKQLRKINR